MPVVEERTYVGNELTLEVALLKLSRAVNELTAAVNRLADKEHMHHEDRARDEDEYRVIVESLTKVKQHIQDTIETLS